LAAGAAVFLVKYDSGCCCICLAKNCNWGMVEPAAAATGNDEEKAKETLRCKLMDSKALSLELPPLAAKLLFYSEIQL
jgi:hypothetical protein